MKQNLGKTDRIIRLVLGILAAILGYAAGGTLGVLLYVVAAISLLTAATGFCALYMPFGINTCSRPVR